MSNIDSICFLESFDLDEVLRESKNPPLGLRWVVSLLGNEPRGRHLYGVDHHQLRIAIVLLIEWRVVLAIGRPVNLTSRMRTPWTPSHF
jgi:hypothetical protein